ncbi:MAG: RluA family pseudouridine synthase [Myxococcales bacterium]
MRAELPILYRDEALIAVDKPSGLLVHRGWGQAAEILVELLEAQLGAKVYPVHRLDRATSGVLLLGLSSDVARRMQAQFEAHTICKRYLALVRGRPPASFEVDHPVPRSEDGPRVPAQTAFRTLESVGHLSVVLAEPRSGRLHQIRRHLKHVSHPIIGDANYGKGALNRELRARCGLARLALHASSLAFTHPLEDRRVVVSAPLPEDLAGPLRVLGFDPSAHSQP